MIYKLQICTPLVSQLNPRNALLGISQSSHRTPAFAFYSFLGKHSTEVIVTPSLEKTLLHKYDSIETTSCHIIKQTNAETYLHFIGLSFLCILHTKYINEDQKQPVE